MEMEKKQPFINNLSNFFKSSKQQISNKVNK